MREMKRLVKLEHITCIYLCMLEKLSPLFTLSPLLYLFTLFLPTVETVTLPCFRDHNETSVMALSASKTES
jgi:hypothetical protein